jgi:hypothetical protein
MRDRLSYAVIGFVFGAGLAAILWWLYGLGMSPSLGGSATQPGFGVWLKYVGGGFALAGFILKDRVGDLAGRGLHTVYDAEMLDIPLWLVCAVLAAVSFAVWYFVA